jgi:T6SS, Phospholipase effector Tle1-like, catalytic domain
MPKRIVVCSDGTGNSAIKGRGTNVFKLFEAVDLETHRFDAEATPQIAIYDDGVGTEKFKPLKILSGATGWGLSRNVKHLYKELARVYDPGDDIYMFGFSRGAFTVRTLVGFIQTCGLVDPERLQPRTFGSLQKVVNKGYKAYRKCYRPALWQMLGQRKSAANVAFKKEHSLSCDIPIRFIGVWDTVDAVGLPFRLSDVINATIYQFKFSDHKLSPLVQRACQALAIDDQRESFAPLLWTEEPQDKSRIQQVWFAGAHSNVGGGYPKQGMSLVALDWLLSEAERPLEPAAGQTLDPAKLKGLRICANERQSFREHASVDDKLYDPRSGTGMFYRWKIRDIAALCAHNNVTPKVHASVLERIAHGTDDYSPGNLPSHAEVVFTPPPKGKDHTLAEGRAKALQRVLATIPDRTLLNLVRQWVSIGRASYFLYLASCTVGAFALYGALSSAAWSHSMDYAADAAGVVAVVGLLAAYAMSVLVDSRMESVFSGFWYPKQKELRDGLKHARQLAHESTHEIVEPRSRFG